MVKIANQDVKDYDVFRLPSKATERHFPTEMRVCNTTGSTWSV